MTVRCCTVPWHQNAADMTLRMLSNPERTWTACEGLCVDNDDTENEDTENDDEDVRQREVESVHIPAAMDDEFHIDLWCKTHKCTPKVNPDAERPVIEWVPAWQMFRVNLPSIICDRNDGYNGECWLLMLTDANRYLHGTHCSGGVVLCDSCHKS